MDELSQAYQLLGVKPGATAADAKQAYRDLVKVWHPDRFTHDQRLQLVAQDKLKEINTAHDLVQSHIAGELAPPPEVVGKHRTRFWVTLALAAVFAVAAVLLFGKYQDLQASKPTAPLKTNQVATSPTPTNSGTGNPTSARPIPKPTAPASKPYDGPYALSFDGSGGHMELQTTGSLSGTFTVECWVLSHRPKQDGTLLSSRSPQDFGFDIKLRQGKRYHADIGNGRAWLMQAANITFGYGREEWHHLAYVVTPTDYTAYVDDKLTVQKSLTKSGEPLLYDEKHRLFIGTDPKDNAALNGKLAELRIWSTARTAAELKAGRTAKLTGKEPGLRGWWRFTEGEGKLTEDGSGHEFWGKISGTVTWTTNLPPGLR